MTIDPTDTPIDDSSMFAPVPAWERGKKRRGAFGRRPAAEPRSFASAAAPDPILDAPLMEPQIDRLNEVDPASSTFAAAPIYVTGAKARSRAPISAPVAIAAGLILIGGIAAAGWYYTQPHGQTGVAELTPGGSTTTTTTATSEAPAAAAPPSQVAQNTPPPAVAKTTTTTRRSTVTTRTRAAPPRSRAASETAADASTTVPAQPAPPPMPLPTPGVAPPAAAATPAAPLVLNVPPAATAPAAAAPQPVTPQAAPQAAAPPPTQVPQA